MEHVTDSNVLPGAHQQPSAPAPAPARDAQLPAPIPVKVKARKHTTGQLLGRDLPQTPAGMAKRPWGRSCRTIDVLLKGDDRDAFDRLLAHPRTTRKSAHAWLAAHGVKVSPGTVGRYRDAFDRDTAELRNATRTAAWVTQAAEEGHGERMPSAALSIIEQHVMQALLRRDEHGAPPGGEQLFEAAKVLTLTVDARRKLLDVARELEKARKSGTGATPLDVAIRVRQMLGLRIPPEVMAKASPAISQVRSGGQLPDATSSDEKSRLEPPL